MYMISFNSWKAYKVNFSPSKNWNVTPPSFDCTGLLKHHWHTTDCVLCFYSYDLIHRNGLAPPMFRFMETDNVCSYDVRSELFK